MNSPTTNPNPGSFYDDRARRLQITRRGSLALLASGAATLSGCPLSMPETPPPTADARTATNIPITDRVAEVLQVEKETRGLSTMLNGAWQIFHGILAYGDEFEIDTPSGRQSALSYFREGGNCSGFQPTIGDRIGNSERFGLRVDIQPQTKVGQGHRDQWLAVVAQAGVPLEATWKVEDRTFTIEDWLWQAEWDVPLNYETEFSWTLIPLSYYRSTGYTWRARDGGDYSTDLLLEVELEKDLEASVCGGTHRLIGIATAMRNRKAEGSPVVGVWDKAQKAIDAGIELARINQNPDGTYSTSYMHRTGWCSDLGETLGTTGHVLEFLAMSADQETLQSQWVQRSVHRLCDVLEQCRGVDLECGVLYHALHGLVEYGRRFSTA